MVFSPLTPLIWAAERASGSHLQAAQRPRHLGGVEPHRLERVRRLRSRRRGQPVGSVGGVVRRGGPGGRSEGPASSAPVPAPGSDRGQGDPLAPAGPWRDGLHRSVRIQRVQDRVGVEDVWSGINPFKIPVGTSMSGAVNPCLIV